MTTSWRPLSLVAILGLATATTGRPSIASAQQSASPGPPAAGAALPSPREDKPSPPIRDFDLETLSRLGREIYRHDQLAWTATDVVVAKVGEAQMRVERCNGWVVDTSGPAPLVRFVRKTAAGEEAAYDVRFPKGADPTFEVPANRTLTPKQSSARTALLTALAPFEAGKYPLCRARGNYNFVVLDDPAGDGFLVYLLRPKDSSDSVPIGGHYRISVAPDGKTIKQVDRLSATCLTINKSELVGSDGKLVAIGMNHVVSATPLETHVFLSLQEGLPFYIITKDGRSWMVENGTIKAPTEKSPAANATKSAKP